MNSPYFGTKVRPEMQQQSTTIARSPGTPAVMAIEATDGYPPTVEEHRRQAGTTLCNPPSSLNEADDRHRQNLQRERQLSDERQKTNQLQTANQEVENEVLAWREKCSQAESYLQDERREHSLTKAALQQRQQDANHWYSLLQEANRAIGGATNKQQASHQLDDTEITMRTKRLRVDIRDFALRYAKTDMEELRVPTTSYSLLKDYLRLSSRVVDTYIQFPSTRPAVIRAFLCAFLDEKVFRQFVWAPKTIHKAMKSFFDFTDLSESKNPSNPDAEVECKLNMWRVNTTNLLLEIMDGSNEEAHDNLGVFVSREAARLADCLEPIVSCSSADLIDPLSKLLDESLALDQVLSQQVAKWSWHFPRSIPCQFDQGTMGMATHKRHTGQSQEVQLVLSPALVKRGKSSGDGFDVDEVHIKMEVECGPLPRITAGNGSLFRTIQQTAHSWKENLKQIALDKKGHDQH
ncbi:hypothetical protein CNMCM5623_001284 [Aspergillus felis]|uniref:Uncharacterized protein n=1 Tax=Aspergillus felis TaxID=1287682 RepID=A0A8H6R1N4_9EURO|nr:hypothetical protein CNMCM5623_001284 [Aspergillus felis]KAF7182853.1 hypothetical protein CNMCM7691_002597 [Aspergillus felis]